MRQPARGPVNRMGVEVRPVVEGGTAMILVQLPYGYVVVSPDSARRIADALVACADDAERGAQ